MYVLRKDIFDYAINLLFQRTIIIYTHRKLIWMFWIESFFKNRFSFKIVGII